jgi:hypothetical protein
MEALFQCVDQVRIGRGETVTLLLDGPSLGTSELGLFMHRLAKRSSDLRGGTLQIYDRTAGKVYPFAIDVGVERMPPMAVKRT